MKGLITKKQANNFWVNAGGETTVCTAQKKLKANGIFVGDLVEFDPSQKQIMRLYKRTNKLLRPPVANIDKLIILMTSAPAADLLLLDKLLLFCAVNDITPIICHSKIDLDPSLTQTLKTAYGKHFQVASVSSQNKTGLGELLKLLKGSTSALSGQSGVGKSALLNALTNGQSAIVGSLSEKIARGKNTTRHSQLFEIAPATFLADTAGFSSLDEKFLPITADELARYYPEFVELLPHCKFSSCTHLHEPDCAVKKALTEGKIDKGRYERYKLLYESIKESR